MLGRKSALLLLLAGTGFVQLEAQSLYMPSEIRKAYAKGSRSYDGRPGKLYWQNTARYDMNITVNPPDRKVSGTEEVVYFNNSPDTIYTPEIKLFLNVHKPGAPREDAVGKDYLTNGMVIDAFAVNGKDHPTNGFMFTSSTLELTGPLLPGDSLRLAISWHYEVSVQSGREGMIDPNTFFLAYFYPRVAVYDDYSGWDRNHFTDGHEFYNDFCDYRVAIHAPANYVVWGTGTLQQPESVLMPEFLGRYLQSQTSDAIVRVATKGEMAANAVTKQQPLNKWVFTAGKVPDMAFGISNHFVWDASSVIVDDQTGRRASVQAAFNDTATDYHHMVRFAGDALKWFSRNWPGIAYPYEKMTVFQGYAGMEYPMMANDETYEDSAFSRLVANHEIAHTYMPFYMGVNETRFGFMDEGWVTALELLIGYDFAGKEKAEELFKMFRVSGWAMDRSGELDIPIITPGTVITGKALGNNQYGKAALAYLALKDLQGDVLFKKCLQEYMHRWHGKHPTPWDFFYTFNNVNGQPLDWFWNNWFFSWNYMDIGVKSVRSTPKGIEVLLQNTGGMAIPFDLQISYTDGTTETKHFTAKIWERNTKLATIILSSKKKVRSVTADTGIFIDADTADNTYTNR